MVYDNANSASAALGSCIDKLVGPSVYVGITQNIEQRLRQHEHTGEYCKVECTTHGVARDVESYFLNQGNWNGKTVRGGDGGGDSSSRFVYAFPCR